MRVAAEAHRARGWEISSLLPDFTLLDVWALPITGGRDDADGELERAWTQR